VPVVVLAAVRAAPMPVMGSAPVPAMRAAVVIVRSECFWAVAKERRERHAQR